MRNIAKFLDHRQWLALLSISLPFVPNPGGGLGA